MSRLVRMLVVGFIAALGLVIPATVATAAGPPTITTSSLPTVVQGKTFPATQLKVSGGAWPYTWSVVSPVLSGQGSPLPYGLKMTTGGRITGATPFPQGSPYNITFQVKDRNGVTAVRTLVIVVKPMTITTTSLPAGRKGALYYTALKTDGACVNNIRMQWGVAGPDYSGTGVLQSGLKMSRTGVISGIPKVSGPVTFSAFVECALFNNGYASKTFTLTVN